MDHLCKWNASLSLSSMAENNIRVIDGRCRYGHPSVWSTQESFLYGHESPSAPIDLECSVISSKDIYPKTRLPGQFVVQHQCTIHLDRRVQILFVPNLLSLNDKL